MLENKRTSNEYKCSVIEIHGPVGSGKTTMSDLIKNLIESETDFQVCQLNSSASEAGIIKLSEKFDLIIIDVEVRP